MYPDGWTAVLDGGARRVISAGGAELCAWGLAIAAPPQDEVAARVGPRLGSCGTPRTSPAEAAADAIGDDPAHLLASLPDSSPA